MEVSIAGKIESISMGHLYHGYVTNSQMVKLVFLGFSKHVQNGPKRLAKASHPTRGYGPIGISRLPKSWGYPEKIIHCCLGFSRINHQAIGVPPFMETPIYIYIYIDIDIDRCTY